MRQGSLRCVRSRLGFIAGLAGGAVLGAAIGWALGRDGTANTVLIVILIATGAAVFASLGQIAQWARASAGSARRLEYALTRTNDETKAVRRRVDEVGTRVSRTERDLHRRTDTLTEQITRLTEQLARQREQLGTMGAEVKRSVGEQAALTQAHSQLQRLVPLDQPMPRPGAWAASEDLLLWLVGHVLAEQPRLIVDLGSGQSSVWMAAALREAGVPGRVVAIDHDPDYAEATRALGRVHGVSRWLEVRVAPLVDVTVIDRECRWYDPVSFTDLHGIDLLSVDGPPGKGAVQARWPALPLLQERLSPRAVVVMDDMIRADEREIVAQWIDAAPEWQVSNLDFEKGAAILRRD